MVVTRGLSQKDVTDRTSKTLFVAGLTVIVVAFVAFIALTAVDLPHQDQWDIMPLIIGHSNLGELILHRHNEHFIGTGLLVMKVLAVFGWHPIVEIFFIATMMLVITGMVIWLKYKAAGKLVWWDLLIPLVILNVFQEQNLTWGFQIAFLLPLLFLFVGLAVLTKWKWGKASLPLQIALAVLSVLAVFSSAHGVLVPAIFVLFVLLRKLPKRFRRIMLIILAVGTMWVAAWSRRFFLIGIASGFFFGGHNIIILTLLGVLALSTYAYGLYKLFRAEKSNLLSSTLLGVAIMTFAFGFIALVFLGRGDRGAAQAGASRYVSYEALIVVGMLFVLCKRQNIYLKALLVAVVVISYLSFAAIPFTRALNAAAKRKEALTCYRDAARDFNECYDIFPVHPDRETVRNNISGLGR